MANPVVRWSPEALAVVGREPTGRRAPVLDSWPHGVDGFPLAPDLAANERDAWQWFRQRFESCPPAMLCPVDFGVLVEERRELGGPTEFRHLSGVEHRDVLSYVAEPRPMARAQADAEWRPWDGLTLSADETGTRP